MEDDLGEIEHLVDALFLMAEGANADNKRVSGALYAIGNSLEMHLDLAQKKRGRIFDLTWGYCHLAREGLS